MTKEATEHMIQDKDFRVPWVKPIPKTKWDNFLRHTWDSLDRKACYEIIENCIKQIDTSKYPLRLVEIGFGQCLDFKNCFKKLHDDKKIIYSGYEITEQFTKYALKEYPEYQFETSGFFDLPKDGVDITYTRHTLEHQQPKTIVKILSRLLQATKKLCVISWFQAPRGKESFFWAEKDGFGNTGAWVNIYKEAVINQIIEANGFDRLNINYDVNVQVYSLWRRQ